MGAIRFTHRKAIGNTSKQIEHALNMRVQDVLVLGMGKSV